MSTADKVAAVSLCYSLGGFAVWIAWKNPDWAYRPNSKNVELFGRKLVRLYHFLLGLTLLILSTVILFA